MSLKDWGPGRLAAAWVTYWVLVALVAALPDVIEYLRLQLTDGHGTISHNFSLGGLGTTLVLFGPPLVLWLFWLRTRPRRDAEVAQREP
jgi:hypothetical protein